MEISRSLYHNTRYSANVEGLSSLRETTLRKRVALSTI
jgi:hypothetical protein